MNEERIHELLRRYFEGTTSLTEEKELQVFFSGHQIPDTLKIYQPLFMFFTEEQAIEPPVTPSKIRNTGISWTLITGIAASIAIIFLIGLPFSRQDEYVYYVDGERIYDKVAAIESAEDKLQLLALSMQKARNSMSAFGKVQESNQSLQQLSKLQDAYHQVERLISGSAYHNNDTE